MKPYEYYSDAGEYPGRSVKPQYPIKENAAKIREYADKLEVWEVANLEYERAIKGYKSKQNELQQEFRTDVLQEYGLTGHPKADKVYAMAWDEGHSSGYAEVTYWVEKLAELVL